MRSKSCLPVLAILCAACGGSIAGAAAMPSAIQSRYNALIVAIEKSDIKTFSSLCAPEYVSVDPSGKVTARAQFLTGIRDQMKGTLKASFKVKFTGVKIHNGVVDVSFDCYGQFVREEGTMLFHEVGVDTWKKIGSEWLEIKTVDSVSDVSGPKPTAE